MFWPPPIFSAPSGKLCPSHVKSLWPLLLSSLPFPSYITLSPSLNWIPLLSLSSTLRGHCCCRCGSAFQSCPTLCNPMDCSTPGLPVLHHLPKFEQVHVLYLSDAIHPSHLLTPSSPLPSSFPSIRDFSNESAVLIRWPKYWSFSISPSNEYLGLIFLKIDWFDLLAVQGTFRSLLQHHGSKASTLWHSAFFTVQLWNPYMATG